MSASPATLCWQLVIEMPCVRDVLADDGVSVGGRCPGIMYWADRAAAAGWDSARPVGQPAQQPMGAADLL
jgi:hypothetical protein